MYFGQAGHAILDEHELKVFMKRKKNFAEFVPIL